MAAYRIENDTWSFSADLTYMNLGWSQRTQQGRGGCNGFRGEFQVGAGTHSRCAAAPAP